MKNNRIDINLYDDNGANTPVLEFHFRSKNNPTMFNIVQLIGITMSDVMKMRNELQDVEERLHNHEYLKNNPS